MFCMIQIGRIESAKLPYGFVSLRLPHIRLHLDGVSYPQVDHLPATAAMATRPTVTIASQDGTPSGSTHPLPAVFKAPIRPDIV